MLDPKKLFVFSIERLNCHGQCFRSIWSVPSTLPYFQGHFPNQPVLPAVAIVDASAVFLSQSLKTLTPQQFTIKSAKFLAPVTPDTQVEISAHDTSPERASVVWKKVDDETVLAKLEF